ncbi:nitrate reductase [Thalassomonas actiniarum]|uniref:Nitrate reductase n=1 Tax=Thalassomonas actiniarum TaxID=485447 RepID=A0AAE9YR28_9GAMM|nr:nitrate reductase [Thalassomonas actiniarum]WDD98718.1 nitrate reductase [Thalassomonas actiniarum]
MSELIKHKQSSESKCVQTSCPYCGVGCGVDITVEQGKAVKLSGTPEHPANFGRLCVKGTNLLATNHHQGRLLHPVVNGEQTSWEKAIETVAARFSQIIKEHGPDAVAFYGSGQLLTEDYYVANKLMKGYIGSANIDTNSRLCMSSAVSGYKRAFGEDLVPCSYQDLENTDLILLTGSNAAWTHPVLFQRMEKAKAVNPKLQIFAIDPRRTASAELADFHLPIKPGTDAALFNGLLNFLADNRGLDQAYIDQYTNNFSACLDQAGQWTLTKTADYCNISKSSLKRLYQAFLTNKRVINFFSQGINQSSSGADKCNAIINCHLASGKIGKPGCGPFSITGQPNAMGGREVGGLSNLLAAHMDIDNPEHRALVQNFWQSPTIASAPGYKATDLFDKMNQGKVKAVWIMATNPAVSLPDRAKVEQALANCDFVVVSDCVASNDTLAFAEVKLPASSWSEKNGTVTNSERRISRQRGLLTPPGEALDDWQIISRVAKAMGFDQGFNYSGPAEIFDEHARLTACNNNGDRALDLSGLTGLTTDEYDRLKPVQWPVNTKYPLGCARILADGSFFTDNRKANFIAISPATPKLACSAGYPFSLTSGRLRDQWHTMTRTGKANILAEHTKAPEVTLNPADAQSLGVAEGEMVKVSNETGAVFLQAKLSDDVGVKQLFVPIHWNREFASSATANQLFAAIVDPVSGQPEFKQAPVQVEKTAIKQYALIYSPRSLKNFTAGLPGHCHWIQHQGVQGPVYHCYFEQEVADLAGQLKQHINRAIKDSTSQDPRPDNSWLSHQSEHNSRLIALAEQGFNAFVFISDKPIKLNDSWLNELLENKETDAEQINALLLAKAPKNKGRKICSCFSIYEQDIVAAIENDGISSVDALGATLKCGTNCGSCKTELSSLLREHQAREGESEEQQAIVHTFIPSDEPEEVIT